MNNGRTFHHISFPLIKRRVWDNSIVGNNGGYLGESDSGVFVATLGNEATGGRANVVIWGRSKAAFALILIN